MFRARTARAVVLVCALAAGPAAATAQDPPQAGPPAGPSGPSRGSNHLLGQTSPYLLQHLDNPIDWYPWGDEAVARARRENKPIFLSIGYSACHWCHVMEREAFSDAGIAALMNERFVAIKVDREERPDVDEIYMTAVVALTGSGGWPLSVFLTPDLQPFFGATYLPPDRLRAILIAVHEAWRDRRDEIVASAGRIHEVVRAALQPGTAPPAAGAAPALPSLGDAVARLRASYDRVHGGFGRSPKFPPHAALALLLQAHRDEGNAQALEMAVRTLDAMARGGIHDQIGGGFHRYATDEKWRVPHFEKMLYDNALLAPLYLQAWKQTGREDFRRIGEDTLAWALREMSDARGGFLTSLDADSEGEEGRFYQWSMAEVRQALEKDDSDLVAAYYGMSEAGNAPGGRNIFYVPVPLEAFARRRGMPVEAARVRLEAARRALFAARERRPRPRRDDKVLASWNGLMISALAQAGSLTGQATWTSAAMRTARFVLEDLATVDGRLLASWRRGSGRVPGYLDDHAFVARGLLDLHDATGGPRWAEAAERIVDAAEAFRDPRGGGYFFTTDAHGGLIVRSQRFEDSTLPSGNAVLAECLLRLADPGHSGERRARAERALAAAAAQAARDPATHGATIRAATLLTRAAAPVLLAERRDPAEAAPPAAPRAPDGDAAAPASAPSETIVQGVVVGRPAAQQVVEATLLAPSRPVRPGQAVTLSLRLSIAPGWHINSNTPTLDYLIPTRVELASPDGVDVEEIAYPPEHRVVLKFAAETLSVFEGEAVIRATVRPAAAGGTGKRAVKARLTYQACSDTTCLPPQTVAFDVPLAVAGEPVAEPRAGGAAAAPGESRSDGGALNRMQSLLDERGLLVLLGVVFLGGLALNLTPCVYPLVPVTIGFFATQAQAGGGWARRLSLPALYVFGMALTYSVLGVVAGLSGGLIGSTLQNVWVVGGLVALFTVMALSMFGLFELRVPATITRLGGGRRGSIGALVMGLTMGLVAAPCIGPFVVGLLAFVGASGKPLLGFWLFFVLALGMGLPFLLLGAFSGALSTLPRSGQWLVYAKKVMGIGLLAVALYFVQPFVADRVLGWIVLVFAVVSGLYLAILERTSLGSGWFLVLKAAVGVLVVVAGVWLSLPLVQARPEPAWQPYSQEAFGRAALTGKPILIDFYAEWCLPCKELDRYTFADPEVLRETERFVLLKADLTQFESEQVRAVRGRFDVVGVPTLVFVDSRGREDSELRLYGFEEPGAFLERLRQVR